MHAFLSGLGMMGRRHLKGLARAGVQVTAFDPSENSARLAAEELEREGLSADALQWESSIPSGMFDLAVFSETADYRFENVRKFLSGAKATRYLLEKPLSSNPEESHRLPGLFSEAGVSPGAVSTNFPRRSWGYIRRLKELCTNSGEFQLTLNGGAIGLGCNGIHQLELYLYLNGGVMPEIRYCKLSQTRIASGRGERFWDFGGTFLLESPRSAFFCSVSADSSAPSMLTLRGNHFAAWVDESDRTWRVMERSPESALPNYRYGADYRITAEGKANALPLDEVTRLWVSGEVNLPGLDEALAVHDLLDRILLAGGATPPYHFT